MKKKKEENQEKELDIRIGDMEVKKGTIRNMPFMGWDSIGDCKGEECEVFAKCGIKKKVGPCKVQVKYLEAFMSTVLSNYLYLDEMCLFQIGMHLMPLYSQLCKLKLVEKGLDGRMMVYDSKGTVSVHPVYREIRSTLIAISGEWRRLELFRNGVTMPDIDLESRKEEEKKKGKIIDLEKGDAGYYKSISRDAGAKRKVIR